MSIGKYLVSALRGGVYASLAIILTPTNANADVRSWYQKIVEAGEIGNGYSHGQYPSEKGFTHPGIDIGGGCGLPVKAAADGIVVRVVTEADGKDYKELGNSVVIQHKSEPDGRPTFTLYLHMMDGLDVASGPIFEGDLLGHTGDTGFAEGCHLHFEVRHFEGLGDIYNPRERQIYVKGDRGGPRGLEPDWSDPEQWINQQESRLGTQRELAPKVGTLRRGINGIVATLDPHRYAGDWEDIVMGDMFVGLLDRDPSGKLIPGVAASWTQNSAGLVWTFNLRRDVTWSDGVALKATDFVYAFQRLQDPKLGSAFASNFWVIKNAEQLNSGELTPDKLGVRAVDDFTLEVTLNQKTPHLLEILSQPSAYPVPPHVVQKKGEAWIHPDNIAVNGPYKLTYWNTADQLVARKNPTFWAADSVCHDKVVFFEIEDVAKMEAAVASGELDIASAFDANRTPWLRQNLPRWVRTVPNLHLTYWIFNQEKPPFDDARVRRALAMSVDRDMIVANELKPGYTPAYSFVPPAIANYETSRPKFYWKGLNREKRLEEARTLLRQAGFGPDNPLTFEFIHRSTGESPKVAQLAQAQWNEIAPWVEAKISSQRTPLLYSRLRSGDFEIADAAWRSAVDDPIGFLELLDSRVRNLNWSRYRGPKFDELLTEAAKTPGLVQRAALLARAEKLVLDEAVVSPMWFGSTQNLVAPKINGWAENASDVHRSRWMCGVKSLTD